MINEYFDNIYLLNLKRRKDRLDKSIKKLNELDIKFDIFNGTDGSVIKNIWEKFNNSNFSNPNYLGCAISHLSIYQHAVQNDYQKILIIEDDNLINKNINTIFENIIIPEWNDIFYLGYIPLNDDCSMWDYRWGLQGHNMLSDNIFNPRNLWGLFAYGLTNKLMKELLDIYINTFPMELDRYFVKIIQPRNNSIAISPQLFCCEDNNFSDNLGFIAPNMTQKSIDSRFANIYDYI
jgi:GR25 family glycosyltransferase involved in LPS biosynthesis